MSVRKRYEVLPRSVFFMLRVFVVCALSCALNPVLQAAEFEITDELIKNIEKKYGEYAGKRMRAWRKVIEENKGKSEAEQLEAVNLFFNLITYRSDSSHWGKNDYWATPMEFLATNGGDCEDYSIAKYFTLLELGVPDKKLRITYVKALNFQAQAHMVLTYYKNPKAEPLVLDNINGEILPASKRKDLKPVYSFNGTGLWKATETRRGKRVGKSSRVDLWTELLDRMKKQKGDKAP